MHWQMFVRVGIGLLTLVCVTSTSAEGLTTDGTLDEKPNTDLTKEYDDALLLLSTLDGSIYGVGQQTGQIRWKFKDEPVVKVPLETGKAIVPLFLPDPKDGSLYLLGRHDREALKKLPFTIPQLVASSPCRSSDGILYVGKKTDTWFSVDPKTGLKQPILSFDKIDKTCPAANSDWIFVGRTEYNIMMFDSKTSGRSWNITFYDYTSATMETDTLNDYDMVHLTASSTGQIITLDRRLGNLVWTQDVGSPVIAVYLLRSDGLVAVPFTSVADQTLGHFAALHSEAPERGIRLADVKLYPTLYIGEHVHGLYALPSLVDDNTVTVSTLSHGPYLLEGPKSEGIDSPGVGESEEAADPTRPKINVYDGLLYPGQNFRLLPNYIDMPLTFQSLPKGGGDERQPIIMLGHYKVPEYSATQLRISGRSDVVIREPHNIVLVDANKANDTKREFVVSIATNSIGVQTYDNDSAEERIDAEWAMILNGNVSFVLSKDFLRYLLKVGSVWASTQESLGLKVMLTAVIVFIMGMLWHIKAQVREFQQLSRGSGSSSNGNRNETTAYTKLPEGLVRVGSITFNPEEILGKGCEGTFVFKGEFDNRAVAVKRLLPECFTFADREVDLLRISDDHPNVIRYFCTAQDEQFRYIALELCPATLKDYVDGRYACRVEPVDVCRQATAGLAHLHRLDIVHRDIKPHNLLLSAANSNGEVRVMISDFGLCKKLELGRMSFSRRSGVTGTDGWIAPEMLDNTGSTTCLVDIFSLGCVFYYVLTNGKHPFGDALHRQANIMSGKPKLNELDNDDSVLTQSLIALMLSQNPSERPPALAVLQHPVFWEKKRVLGFLMDTSDRVETDGTESEVFKALESGGSTVLGKDWRFYIDAELGEELKRYRSYCGTSVRDLLRALRNKRHHYRELSEEIRKSFGSIPDQFVHYWTSRYPNLLMHTWLAMQCIKNEPIFGQYYPTDYEYKRCGGYKPRPMKSDGGIVNSWMETLGKKSSAKAEKAKKKPTKSAEPFWSSSPKPLNWRRDNFDKAPADRRERVRWERNDELKTNHRNVQSQLFEKDANDGRVWREGNLSEKENANDRRNASGDSNVAASPPPGFQPLKAARDWWEGDGYEIGKLDVKGETVMKANQGTSFAVNAGVGNDGNQDSWNVHKNKTREKQKRQKKKTENTDVPLVWTLPPTS